MATSQVIYHRHPLGEEQDDWDRPSNGDWYSADFQNSPAKLILALFKTYAKEQTFTLSYQQTAGLQFDWAENEDQPAEIALGHGVQFITWTFCQFRFELGAYEKRHNFEVHVPLVV